MTPEEYCNNKLIASGSSNYYSFLFLAPDKRKSITAVFAFCQELDIIVDNHINIDIAQQKFDWWQYEISQLYQQKAQHPVTKALSVILKNIDLPEEYFLEIIDGKKMALTVNRYQTFSELSLYCYRVASIVELIATEIFTYQNKITLKYAHNLGIAIQLTRILRDTQKNANRNQIYIPQEELHQFSVSEKDLVNNNNTKNCMKLFEYQSTRAYEYFSKAISYLPEQDRNLQSASIIQSKIYLALLTKIKQNNYTVLATHHSLSSLKELWIAWRTARKENKRYKNVIKNK
jgi:phytoene synthase